MTTKPRPIPTMTAQYTNTTYAILHAGVGNLWNIYRKDTTRLRGEIVSEGLQPIYEQHYYSKHQAIEKLIEHLQKEELPDA